jgi:hypothetical protein
VALHIQRCLGPVGDLEPGQYTLETASGKPAVCCAGCGGISDVVGHVEPGGAVRSAWTCPTATCSFLEWIVLEAFGS